MRLQDIAIVTGTPLDTDHVLLEKFKAHDRVAWDPKTDLYSYKVCNPRPFILDRRKLNHFHSTNSTSGVKLPSSPKSSDRPIEEAESLFAP